MPGNILFILLARFNQMKPWILPLDKRSFLLLSVFINQENLQTTQFWWDSKYQYYSILKGTVSRDVQAPFYNYLIPSFCNKNGLQFDSFLSCKNTSGKMYKKVMRVHLLGLETGKIYALIVCNLESLPYAGTIRYGYVFFEIYPFLNKFHPEARFMNHSWGWRVK